MLNKERNITKICPVFFHYASDTLSISAVATPIIEPIFADATPITALP